MLLRKRIARRVVRARRERMSAAVRIQCRARVKFADVKKERRRLSLQSGE